MVSPAAAYNMLRLSILNVAYCSKYGLLEYNCVVSKT
jgi:hypothetical protein